MDDFINELKQKNKDFSEEYINMMKQYYQKLMNNPAELQNTLNNLKSGKNGIDPDGGITITPEPYCCVKVQDETGQKIFLNLCGSDHVDPPKEQHILEMNNQEGIRIPLSLSEKYEDFDVHGTACEVYDIIMNPSTLQKTENQPLVMGFILNLIASRLKERFKKVILIDKYVRLKNLKYKGKTVRSQRIRARKVKIDEIIDNSNEKDKNLKEKNGDGGLGQENGIGDKANIANEHLILILIGQLQQIVPNRLHPWLHNGFECLIFVQSLAFTFLDDAFNGVSVNGAESDAFFI